MTELYEVHTGHSKKVLKSFAKLHASRASRSLIFRLSMLAIILFTIPRALHAPTYGYAICWSFGILVILVAIGRPQLAYWNLLARDDYYKNNTPITITFGHSQFVVDDGNIASYKYYIIDELYADKDLLYLRTNEDDLFLFERSDFTVGNADDFYDFMQQSTGKEFQPVNLNLKQKWFKLRRDMKQAEAAHDQKVSDKKKGKKK